jgi:hypothetical protein
VAGLELDGAGGAVGELNAQRQVVRGVNGDDVPVRCVPLRDGCRTRVTGGGCSETAASAS